MQNPSLFTRLIYQFRWPLSLISMALVVFAMMSGGKHVGHFTDQMTELGDTSNGSGIIAPLVFDPRMDLWFGSEDKAVLTYREIEKRFVAEDYIMVTYEHDEGEFGVFGRESLATIARLTDGFLRIPGVRHVRSLTSNPWIRYGEIEDEFGSEEGLLISDLFEGDPALLTDEQIIERMIAVLGAERVAKRLGAERVRSVLGDDADFANYIGEPLLLGTILDETGKTTAIQIQVLRPKVAPNELVRVFGDDEERMAIATDLYSVQAQRASLRGIEHFVRLEKGLAIEAPGLAALTAYVEGLEEGPGKQAKLTELADPRRNFMFDGEDVLVRKFFEYDPAGETGFVDKSDVSNLLDAPAGFAPEPMSDFVFHVGGVPLFERNFEDVGMSDSIYMGVMFLAIMILLALVFRSVVGVVAPMMVVFGSVIAMVGSMFGWGDLFNNMTIVAPNMVTAVSIADSVHLVAAWLALRSFHTDKRELIMDVVQRNAMPIFLTSITTAVGFYSLTVSEMIPVKMLGYTSGFGTLLAYGLSMTIVPALLSLMPLGKPKSDAKKASKPMFSGWEERLTDFVFRRRAAIVAVSLVLLVMAGVGIVRLRIDSDFRAMFPDDNQVISDFNWIESRLGGVGDLEIVFEGLHSGSDQFDVAAQERLDSLRLDAEGARLFPDEFAVVTAESASELADLEVREAAWQATRIAVSGRFLSEVDAFETRLREEMANPESPLSVVTDLISPLDILRRMHQVQNESDASYYRVPEERDVAAGTDVRLDFDEWSDEWLMIPKQDASTLAAQYYLQYENGAKPGENLATQVSMDRVQFRIQGRLRQAPSVQTVAAAKLVEEIARSEFPFLGAHVGNGPVADGSPDLKVSGKMLLFARTVRIFTIGFMKSMSLALVVTTLLIAMIFRSVRIAIVSLIPNLLPILLPLAAFGLLGIPLDAPAIFVSSVALGVCVDDSIHFFTKFMRARGQGQSVRDSVRYTYEAVGTAITFTTIILIIGFGMLVFSDFRPNYLMGTLAATMIGLAWLADLLVTPAVLSYVTPSIPEDEQRS